MLLASFRLVFLLFAVLLTQIYAFNNGFASGVDWVPYNQALSTAKSQRKPVFLLVYSDFCEECRKLKKEFAESDKKDEFAELSKKFVMTNINEEEVKKPADEEFSPDGRYVPRIVFLSPDGKRISSVTNVIRHRHYLHFYDRLEDIINGMKKALSA